MKWNVYYRFHMRKTFVKKIVCDIVVVFQVETKCKTIWGKLSY